MQRDTTLAYGGDGGALQEEPRSKLNLEMHH